MPGARANMPHDTMNAPALLVAASAAVLFLFGFMHLVFTFRGKRFDPRDATLKARMMEVAPVISRETTMWKAWVGFNASHSYGVLLYGAVYGYLALAHPALLFQSWFLLALGVVLLAGYVFLARLYWFSTPYRGVLVASALYLAGIALHLAG